VAAGIPARLMIDFSHGNSSKNPQKQVDVAADVAGQLAAGEERVIGVMFEGHLKAGRQDLVPGKELTYGMSITDGCIGWDDHRKVLGILADAVRQRRLKAQRAE
jgi:3-deoxy-7-phosphoheptulonate synthase